MNYRGGDWVVNKIDDYDSAGRHLAEIFYSIVVMVDYRKVPEYPFPTSVNDCYAALGWVDENRGDINAINLAHWHPR